MAKSKSFAYSEDKRLKMLQAICDENPSLFVDTCEYGDDGRGHTYDTLCKLQKKYPGYKLVFVIGADKLTIVPKWHSHDEFFKNFEFAVTHRSDIDMAKTIQKHPVLSQHKDIFHEITVDEDMSDISSTTARYYIGKHATEALKQILEPSTMALI